VRAFLAGLADGAISTGIQQDNLGFLCSNGYVARISREDHERQAAEFVSLNQETGKRQQEEEEEAVDEKTLRHDEKHVHGIRYHFEGRERKEAEKSRVEKEIELVTEERAEIAQEDAKVMDLIKKKSALDMQTQYGSEYLALTDLGVEMLHDLNIREYRVAGNDFSDFMDECKATADALHGIAQRARFYADNIRPHLPSLISTTEDEEEEEMRRIKARGLDSQLWAVSIGLAKIQTDNQSDLNDLMERYLRTFDLLEVGGRFESSIDSKLIAAEIITLSSMLPTEEQIQALSLLDEQLRHAHVPEDVSIQTAATILCGGGSLEKFKEFAQITKSNQAAAMLSTIDIPSDQLRDKFKSFKSVFDSWGYSACEDTDLAAAYLSTTNLTADDIGRDPQTKMNIIVNGVKNDLEFPLLPAAILTSIAALNAREVLDLMEKGAAILHSVATDLEHSELASLAVRMVYGQ
jgi:hypothetical protein